MIPVGNGQGLYRLEAKPVPHTKMLFYLSDACFPSKRVEVEVLYYQTDEDESANPDGVVLLDAGPTWRTTRTTWQKLYVMKAII